MTAVVNAFRTARGRTGAEFARTMQIKRANQFFDLLDFGRREGVLDNLSSRFTRHP